jgi:glutamate dehydrogenase (NADP+)
MDVPCDIALPCATQNELDGKDAEALHQKRRFCVAEGANKPSTPDAVSAFHKAKVLFAPAKASMRAASPFPPEMSQNKHQACMTFEEVDSRLQDIMKNIFKNCYGGGGRSRHAGQPCRGRQCRGFLKVANAMLWQGIAY